MSLPSYLLAAICLALATVACLQAYQRQIDKQTIGNLRKGIANANANRERRLS